jgi:hypothetical protein
VALAFGEIIDKNFIGWKCLIPLFEQFNIIRWLLLRLLDLEQSLGGE